MKALQNLRRKVGAMIGGFEGGLSARRLKTFAASRAHVNTLIQAAGADMTARARYLIRNNGYAANAVESWAGNAVGTGIKPSSGIADAVLKDRVQRLWLRWTDESDAEWLMLLHQYGLLKASFQPHNDAKRMRTLTRHRDTLSREASSIVLRMQKAMQQMNIKLTLVLSDITGKSGIRIIEAILAGERDPKKLAELADIQCKTPKEEIAKALEGNWEEDLMFVLRQNYDTFKHYCTQLGECDAELEKLMENYRAEVAKVEDTSYSPAKKRRDYKKTRHTVGFDVERKAYEMWGVNVFEIPGISHLTALELMSELGHDFTRKFPSSKQFCCWCNISPNTKISGGKRISSHVPHRRNNVGLIFRSIASSLANAKNQLGNFYRRIRSRAGGKAAVIATAHKVAEIFFAMVANQTTYNPERVGIDEKVLLEKRIARYKRELERITGMHIEIGNACVP